MATRARTRDTQAALDRIAAASSPETGVAAAWDFWRARVARLTDDAAAAAREEMTDYLSSKAEQL
jgi:hypothetical protein